MNWTKGERWDAEGIESGLQGTGENEGSGSPGLLAWASLFLLPQSDDGG